LQEPSVIQGWIDTAARSGKPTAPEGWVEQSPMQVPVRWSDPQASGEGQVWFKRPENELRMMVDGKMLFSRFKQPQMSSTLFTLGDFISLVLLLAFAFAVAFQLPLVMLALGWVGVLDLEQMAGARKYALFACFIVGALLTPADPFSQIALAVPLYALYEFGLFLVRYFVGRPQPLAG